MVKDEQKIANQVYDIYKVMIKGGWWTHLELSDKTGHPVASIGQMVRKLALQHYGGHKVEKRKVGGNLYEYRITAPSNSRMEQMVRDGVIKRRQPALDIDQVQEAFGELTTALIMMNEVGTELRILEFVRKAHARLQVELDKIKCANKHGKNIG